VLDALDGEQQFVGMSLGPPAELGSMTPQLAAFTMGNGSVRMSWAISWCVCWLPRARFGNVRRI
jgi:hypothetical protein